MSKKPLKTPSRRINTCDSRFEGKEQILALFRELGINYIDQMIFTRDCTIFMQTKKTDYLEYNTKSEFVKANIAKYREANPEVVDANNDKYLHQIESIYMAPNYIKWLSDEVGYGLYASEDIPAGSLIGEYSGLLTPKNKVKNRTWSWSYPCKGSFIETLPLKASVDGSEYGNELRFINHSTNSNARSTFVYNGTTWVNCYFSSNLIAKDEELLVNYGEKYWKTRTEVKL